ncbi:hypothetical protein CEUSTIGMA_g9930.t1 [Chlamydomonas eustigma]|uniref:Uncharacterized protein n=1 Tax=Chlamydomonas eustigma TaxID=1157962 RepID=A0A250XHH9_9CHLO|nr:hypothetical protein CEUSTIGMA_g9930.t1 [Chlamydomonas eustigma]|eukprot:GAX82503.1 hypothetical protein CEUSTIGMA_g9930.t1 [Chlamydomonas eustigma]
MVDINSNRRPRSESEHDSECTALHRSRMFRWKPASVVAISSCPAAPMITVGYETGDLELWDLAIMACIQRVVGEGIEVTSVAWAQDSMDQRWRTFAAHLDGTLSEVDWKGCCTTCPVDSNGGVIWALAAQPVSAIKPGYSHQLAAACDDGSVRLFGVEGGEPGAQMERCLAVLQGRLLSCAWHPSGEMLVVGGVDGCIHVLELAAGREVIRITASSRSIATPCIWQLLVLPDGTIVSGDGEGAVQMWDASFGTLLHRSQRHKADVLAIAAAPDGSAVFAAGVDSQVAMFSCGSQASEGLDTPSDSVAAVADPSSWAYLDYKRPHSHDYLDYKRPHSHDVRAMDVVVLPGGRAVLVSGGLDAQLLAYPVGNFLKEHPVRLSRAPQRPLCQVAHGVLSTAGMPTSVAAVHSRLLTSSNDVCDVWQLGQHIPLRLGSKGHSSSGSGALTSRSRWYTQEQGEGVPVELQAGPRHLTQITLGGGARIACSAISPDGAFVSCCSGKGPVRLYRLSCTVSSDNAGSDPVQVHRIGLSSTTGRAVSLALTNHHLIATHPDGTLSCFQLPASDGSITSGTIHTSITELNGKDQALLVSQCSSAEMAGGAVQERQRLSWKQYLSPVSTMAASPDGSLLAASGSQGLVILRLPSVSGSTDPSAGPSSTGPAAVCSMKRVGKVLRTPHDAPLMGLSFSANGKLLAGALASGHLAVYDIEAMRPLQWCLDHDVASTRCLSKLPGALAGCSFHPDPEVQRLVVYSSGGFCHFDLSQPPDISHLDTKRRRSKLPPSEVAVSSRESRGRNGRVILLPDPCVYAGYLSSDAILVLEKPWEEVMKSFAPPLLRHRYGA